GAVRGGFVYVEGDIVVGTEEEVQFARAFWGLQTGATLEGLAGNILDAAVHFAPQVARMKAALHLRMLGEIHSEARSNFRKELDLVEAYLGGDRSGEVKPFGGIIVGNGYLWLNNTVPYTIDAGLMNPSRVLQAIADWQANTNLKFVDWQSPMNDYITFVSGT